MSLNDDTPPRPKTFVLKTADQYELWKARICAKCFFSTHHDPFLVKDEDCIRDMNPVAEGEILAARPPLEWVGRMWLIIIGSLHDDLFIKLTHVQHGHVETMMKEIRAALLVDMGNDVQDMRTELYKSNMVTHCNGDLQAYISYVTQRKQKLSFLVVPERELVSIFLGGLPPTIYDTMKSVFAIKGHGPETFDDAVSAVRIFSAVPHVTLQLSRLKANGLSQSIFAAVPTHNESKHQGTKSKAACFRFAKNGNCPNGTECRFSHAQIPTSNERQPLFIASRCNFCHIRGHEEKDCRKKKAKQKASLTVSQPPIALQAQAFHVESVGDIPFVDHFAMVLTASTKTPDVSKWVLDSGATSCATHDEKDCIDIVPCNINVCAAGSSFNVDRTGTAVIFAEDSDGRPRKLTFSGCLLSDRFPDKLLSLQSFSSKGHTITMRSGSISISHPSCSASLVAPKTL